MLEPQPHQEHGELATQPMHAWGDLSPNLILPFTFSPVWFVCHTKACHATYILLPSLYLVQGRETLARLAWMASWCSPSKRLRWCNFSRT
jgi:hypothetical protein